MTTTRVSTPRAACCALMIFVCLCFAGAPPAVAAIVTFDTPVGSSIAGEPVDAEATFTTSPNSVDITLRNLLTDPNSVKQVITGLFFELSTGQNTGTLDSILGQERWVNANGTFVDGGVGTTGWILTTQGPLLLVDILNNPGQPKRGVIGPPNGVTSRYDEANGSITDNGPHNPFFNQITDFTLTVPGVTDASTITKAIFQFNTVPGDNITGHTPEPGTLMLMLIGAAALRRHTARRQLR